jgi:hypothetical protein
MQTSRRFQGWLVMSILAIQMTACNGTQRAIAPPIEDQKLRDKVIACGAGIDTRAGAAAAVRYDELRKSGEVGINAAVKAGVGIFEMLPPGDRLPAYDKYIGCIQRETSSVPSLAGIPLAEFREIDSLAALDCPGEQSTCASLVPTWKTNGLINLALLRSAEASASSVIAGYEKRHQIPFLNDGWYNNCRSWIPRDDDQSPWIQINLGREFVIERVDMGSEHVSRNADRAMTKFVIKASRSGNPGTFADLYSHDDPSHPIRATQSFSFPPAIAQHVRIEIKAWESNKGPRIDEIEIYGRP